ncbi:hypothetical protein ACFV5G_31485 [Streptomyces sp. NPDC059766]|uniref:hypothetical protein n=1 Tax=Streptomyces sp. NPDC059766 TaxID=3346940 RepID=UPI0036602EC3
MAAGSGALALSALARADEIPGVVLAPFSGKAPEAYSTATRSHAGQSVQLRFRKKGATACMTVRTVKTSSTGTLKTTVTASADGHRRFSFAGTSTTGTATAAGDFADVS